ncbi:MAG TPA: ATP-binding cassette domain-containing protein, partial [Pontiella sp.]|nr:ATP-binding cassette domain-containing protein [Pontiella sp.]
MLQDAQKKNLIGQPHIRIENLEMRYGDFLIQKDLTFTINRGDVFIIMGGSGCGKSTLLKHLIGLCKPAAGKVYYGDTDYWRAPDEQRQEIMKRTGILYQQGAL